MTSSNQPVMLNETFELINPNTATEVDYQQYPLLKTEAVVVAEKSLTILPSRTAITKCCDIDWLSFTVPAYVFETRGDSSNEQARQNAIVCNVSKVLTNIIGFGISHINSSGRNFYDNSYTLEHNTGLICIGGQNDTVMIVINGTGCTYGKNGWQEYLRNWLSTYAQNAKITRIDVAHDLMDSSYDIYWFDEQDTKGGFATGGRKPRIEKRGNWKRPDGKGLTLYIGSRDYSKFCRIYEKGKQLGDKNSKWLRVEVEFKARHFYIPFDVLTEPSKYFLASYPCFHIFDNQNNVKNLERIQRQNLISFLQAIEITKHQFGRYLYAFRDIFKDDKKLLDVLTNIENKSYPERLDVLTIPTMTH